MRPSLSLLVIGAWAIAAVAQAQTAVTAHAAGTQRRAIRPAVMRPVAAPVSEPKAAHPSGRSRSTRPRVRSVTGVAPGRAPAGSGGGVLALGATDITGNKELPKVMVIVPWKSPTDAGGVAPPTDSLLDEVLEPVDRGVFQRRIRYYGQLHDGAVTQGGDRH